MKRSQKADVDSSCEHRRGDKPFVTIIVGDNINRLRAADIESIRSRTKYAYWGADVDCA